MSKHHYKHATLTHDGPGKPATLSNAANDKGHDGNFALHEEIRLGAYLKWEAAGKPSGDGTQFWIEAEKELEEGKKEKVAQGDGWRGDREQERREAEKHLNDGNANVDSHYRDNNRMFQSHGERGHRHGSG
jgi:hypothetical protein